MAESPVDIAQLAGVLNKSKALLDKVDKQWDQVVTEELIVSNQQMRVHNHHYQEVWSILHKCLQFTTRTEPST